MEEIEIQTYILEKYERRRKTTEEERQRQTD
jgi:hypothetical protein